MNYDEWFIQALISIDSKVKTGQSFEVRSLFDGIKWNTLSAGEKKSFGRYFANAVREGSIKGVVKCFAPNILTASCLC